MESGLIVEVTAIAQENPRRRIIAACVAHLAKGALILTATIAEFCIAVLD
jgi:hypothetical protein